MDRQRPEDADAYGAVARNFQDLMARANQAFADWEAAQLSGDAAQRVSAAADAWSAIGDVLRARVRAGRWSDALHVDITEAEATSALLRGRDRARQLMPALLEDIIDEMFFESDDPEMELARHRVRESLVRHAYVTAYELDTFPKETLQAIALGRFRERDSAN